MGRHAIYQFSLSVYGLFFLIYLIVLVIDLRYKATNSMLYLDQPPVEILALIFNQLNPLSILLDLRRTCRRFKDIVDHYVRYSVDFTMISNTDFEFLLHHIEPFNVASLTISHDRETFDAVDRFCSHFRSKLFNRLVSLDLKNLDEKQLPIIDECFETESLTSFAIHIGTADNRKKFFQKS